MAKKIKEGKALLKEGESFAPFGAGTKITNENLTDTIALWWLEKTPEDIEKFETLPNEK